MIKGRASPTGSGRVSASYNVPPGPALPFSPTPLDRFPCGSTSTSRTRRPASAREAARLIVVVVLPTPPFWLATARKRPIYVIRPNRVDLVLGTCDERKDRENPSRGQCRSVPRGTFLCRSDHPLASPNRPL